MHEAQICAVAVLETQGTFVLEGALPAPREVYPELRFWGGKVNESEFLERALERELHEELGLSIRVTEEDHIWNGFCENQTRAGRIVPQLFALFRVRIGSVNELTVQTPQSRIVRVPKWSFDVPNLTHFAREGLRKASDPTYTINRYISREAA